MVSFRPLGPASRELSGQAAPRAPQLGLVVPRGADGADARAKLRLVEADAHALLRGATTTDAHRLHGYARHDQLHRGQALLAVGASAAAHAPQGLAVWAREFDGAGLPKSKMSVATCAMPSTACSRMRASESWRRRWRTTFTRDGAPRRAQREAPLCGAGGAAGRPVTNGA
jgi:hypothetical protein